MKIKRIHYVVFAIAVVTAIACAYTGPTNANDFCSSSNTAWNAQCQTDWKTCQDSVDTQAAMLKCMQDKGYTAPDSGN